jgi:hypothetical protein
VTSGGTLSGVAEEARTRGFAAPAFAGCAFVERRLDSGRSREALAPKETYTDDEGILAREESGPAA